MTTKQFFKKFLSLYLWGNLLAMAVCVVLLCFGVKYGLDFYTHHGQVVEVPDVKHKSFKAAEELCDDADLEIVVTDTGYVKSLPPDCVLEQTPLPGQKVKPGHIVYLVINASSTPRLTIPDVIDNSSYRAAVARLRGMGFKLADPQFVPGERDWVYGITCKGRQLSTGDKVSVEDYLVIQVGDGRRSLSDSISYIDTEYEYEDDFGPAAGSSHDDGEDEDTFVPVPEMDEIAIPELSDQETEVVE